jgi:hypothetical protein
MSPAERPERRARPADPGAEVLVAEDLYELVAEGLVLVEELVGEVAREDGVHGPLQAGRRILRRW